MISLLNTSIAAALSGRHPAGVVRRSHPLSQGAAERVLRTARQASRGSRCGSGHRHSGIAGGAGTWTFSEHLQTFWLVSGCQWFILLRNRCRRRLSQRMSIRGDGIMGQIRMRAVR